MKNGQKYHKIVNKLSNVMKSIEMLQAVVKTCLVVKNGSKLWKEVKGDHKM